uniref:UBA domain-containing protein n=1 Tax=Aureoumbra lagunensis TaxID=44058 RepID=A0A7S3NN99_9STRA|mmetsp:Transcript_5400/g.7944  ORF Transcript_5400/g.7944 Transcript_5400/m.7944 type:complete len:336 (+) Transcript_5400:47-1054(+)|eukprot:CAMPEP_0197314198 /NCGR_PEP_ID=MMETSP0891-20130614/32611_1 /TAXON_ID=44058 ORGANISM="Aureoumbra lagunensis, Strain CCMP1510" /NCGR_SAMPLE_ID=MMETSP0891 /ASSEMBLY_ACC=CAM_ASM_000534 /LENGTH=335 /DNA_ID=CAMNT_0042802509 /DNA_START=18 /DNA_END=1025 /DNA_ORIENTATION=+
MATESLIDEMALLGFNDREEVRRALNRSAGDVNRAAEMLATKTVPKEEDEMDVLAELSAKENGEILKKKHLDPHERKHGPDPWIPKEDRNPSAGQLVDQRLQTFKEMGFSVEDTEHALRACDNDVTRALDWLLARRSEEQWFSPSPYDVVCEADDPYGLKKEKKRPDQHVPNDPKKGDFYKDLSLENADPAEVVDNRIAEFHSMGFPIADIERALKAAHNDCDRALTLLLNQNTHGYFSEAPQDVLIETEDPYRLDAKKRGHNDDSIPKTDPAKLSNYTSDLPPSEQNNPAAVLDARLSRFLDMGFSVQDAESALEKSNNDVNAALSLLLSSKKN